MNKKLEDKNVLITGGSSGIGKAITLGFAKEGANIVIVYNKNTDGANKTIAEVNKYNRKCFAIQHDISQPESIPKLFKKASNFLDNLNILINNAGAVRKTPFLDIHLDQIQYVFNTNLIGPFILSQCFCKYLIEKKRTGNIINISSLSAISAISKLSDYQSSKAALSMLTKGAAFELAPYNIRVNTISPGLTCTSGNEDQWKNNPDIWQKRTSHIPLRRAGQPDDHVAAAIFLASDDASWVTGANIVIDGGQSVV